MEWWEEAVGPGEAYVPPAPAPAPGGLPDFTGAPGPNMYIPDLSGLPGVSSPGPITGPSGPINIFELPRPAAPAAPAAPGGGSPGGGANPYDAYLAFLREQENARQMEQRRNAIAAVRASFLSIGLDQQFVDELTASIESIVNEGYTDPTAISVMLRQTAPYKKRFIANEKRIQRGLSALSPAEYLQLERRYSQLMREAGLPTGFYDTIEDYRRFLEADVSPEELGQRITLATETTNMSSPVVRNQLREFYGLDDNQLTAYFLDPDRARMVLQKQVNVATVGGFLAESGFNVGLGQAERLTETQTLGRDVALNPMEIRQRAQTAARLTPLTRDVVGGEMGLVGEEQLLAGVVGQQVDSLGVVQREQQRRQAEYRRGGALATTGEGVVGLRRARR